jgi:voltage-gated potassium channel
MYYFLKLFELSNIKLKYLFTNIIIVVLFALIYWIFGSKEHFQNISMPKKPNLSFLDALYFSFTTNCTLGYGDIVPISDAMKIVSIIHTLFMITYLFLVSV